MPGSALIGPLPAGVVGKLPAHGDFVRRGTDAALLGWFDRWLAEELGRADPEWLEERLPLLPGWCFLLAGEARCILGVMMASGDRVGRVFPVVAFAAAERPVTLADARRWCEAAREMIATARDDGADAAAIVVALSGLAVEAGEADASPASGTWWWIGESEPLRFADLPSGTDFNRLLAPDEVTA